MTIFSKRRKQISVIFITRDINSGGTEEVLLRLLSELDRSSFSAKLYVLYGGGTWLSRVPIDVPVYVGAERLRFRRRYDWPLLFAKTLWLARHADVIVGTNSPMAVYIAYIVGWVLKRPSIGWIHLDYSGVFNYVGYPKGVEKVFFQGVYKKLRQVIFVSKAARDSLACILGMKIPPSGWQVLYNPIPVPAIPKNSNISASWANAAFSVPVILATGRLELLHKGFDLLIRAFALLCERKKIHAHLVILGEGQDRAKLEAEISNLCLTDKVWLPGWVENPIPYMRQAAVFVLSSRFEGLPNVLIEALGVGTPIVAFDCPSGPREILCDGEFGVLVPPGDIPALTDALSRVLLDRELAERLRKIGPMRAANFAPEVIIPKWEILLAQVANSASTRESL